MGLRSSAAALAFLLPAVASSAGAAPAYDKFYLDADTFGINWVKLNDKGQAAGFYSSRDTHFYSFRRDTDGTMLLFVQQFGVGQDLMLWSINDKGRAAGHWGAKGIVIEADGLDYTAFNAGSGSGFGTVVGGMNDAGVVAGSYDGGGKSIPFTRTKKGKIHAIKGLEAYSASASAISDGGYVCGTAFASGMRHGFFRGAKGKAVVFDVPGAKDLQADDVNDAGTVVGAYQDSNSVSHGYLRTPDGAITVLDIPGAGTRENQGTTIAAINKKGVVAGSITDSNGVAHGFTRSPDGSFEVIDVPGANTSVGTIVSDINDKNQLSGVFSSDGHQVAGFIRKP